MTIAKTATTFAIAGFALGWYILVVLSVVLSVAAFALSVETRRDLAERARAEAEASLALTLEHGGPSPADD